MSDIAHSTITGSLDTAAKFFRTILKAGVSLEQLMLPVDNRAARANFVAFMKAGCPKLSADVISNPEPAPKPSLLELVTTVEVGAIDKFTVRDKFREGKTTDGVKIYWLGDNFKTNFSGKIEEAIGEPETLKISKLKKASVDGPIMAECGELTTETTLGQFWELLKKQGNGQDGALLVNGWANIAYIRDQNGTLWVVRAYWFSGRGWYVEAVSVTFPVEWDAGLRVVSR